MGTCMITFRSVMPAQRAEKVLKQTGITGTLTRTPKWMEKKGCGYSYRIPCDKMDRAVRVLTHSRIAYSKLYMTDENGNLQELTL